MSERFVIFDDAVMDDGQLSSLSKWGWAFSSVGFPCVAQRVWAMAVSRVSSLPLSSSGSAAIFPTTLQWPDLVVIDACNAGRVIASVFQFL